MSKIIFIDVDGTLVDYENNLPASARDAIRQARKNGHRVYICTGRSKAEVYEYIWEIGLDGMIGANGGFVLDEDKIIFHKQLTGLDTKKIVDWCHSRKLEFYLESNNGLFASEYFEAKGNPVMNQYSKLKDPTANLTVHDCFPNMIFGAQLYREDVNKISFILNSYQDFLDAKRDFPNLEVHTWGGKGEKALFGDIGVQGIDKAVAVNALVKYLGAKMADTIAVGDAKIDIPMLRLCALGIAMGSGGDEIKEMADYITDGVDNDGLANAFKHFGLI